MLIYLKMAWRDIWRNPRRTVLTIAAIAFACLLLVFMLSFQFGSYETMINSSVKIHTGHLQVQAKGYQDKKNMRLVVPNPNAIGQIVEKIPEVEAYTIRANALSLVSSETRTYGILVTGIDPVKEALVSTLKKAIRQGDFFSKDDTGNVLVGKLLAKNLRVGIGDELTILGQAKDGSVAATVATVTGIFGSGIDEFDRNIIHIPLKDFQDIYAMRGTANEVVIVGESLKKVSAIKKALNQAFQDIDGGSLLVALDWTELTPGLLQSIQLDLVSGFIMYIILIIVVAFSILNTFLMAIFERTKEFGVMLAIGLTPVRLTRLVLIESALLTMTGVIIGIILGTIITIYFQVYGIDITGLSDILSQYGISGRLYPRLSIVSAMTGPVFVLIITFAVALYAALKVPRLNPVEAMTHI